MKTIAITIDEDLLQRLDRLLIAKGTRSKLIRQAISEFIAKQEQLAEQEREIIHRH